MEHLPVSDLGHMDRRYLWRANKRSRRVHIENPETERAFCQVENCSGRPLDGRGAEVPAGRRLCGNCADLAGRNETDYQEPESFASGAMLDLGLSDVQPERRPVHRSKERKPRRSTAKYPRPFNDDLPW